MIDASGSTTAGTIGTEGLQTVGRIVVAGTGIATGITATDMRDAGTVGTSAGLVGVDGAVERVGGNADASPGCPKFVGTRVVGMDVDDENELNALRSDSEDVLRDPRSDAIEKSVPISKFFTMNSSNSGPWKSKERSGSKWKGGSGAMFTGGLVKVDVSPKNVAAGTGVNAERIGPFEDVTFEEELSPGSIVARTGGDAGRVGVFGAVDFEDELIGKSPPAVEFSRSSEFPVDLRYLIPLMMSGYRAPFVFFAGCFRPLTSFFRKLFVKAFGAASSSDPASGSNAREAQTSAAIIDV